MRRLGASAGTLIIVLAASDADAAAALIAVPQATLAARDRAVAHRERSR